MLINGTIIACRGAREVSGETAVETDPYQPTEQEGGWKIGSQACIARAVSLHNGTPVVAVGTRTGH